MSTAAPRGLGRGLGELFQRSEPQPESEVAADDPSSSGPATVPNDASVQPRADAEAPTVPVEMPAGSYFAEIPIESIRPNPKQPRTAFDEDELRELADSIGEIGLLQPIVVRPLDPSGDSRSDADGYELVMGERRWRAAQEADLAAIPAIVRRTEDADLLRDALLENLHRSQLNPLEEAAAYQQMLEDFACSQEELSKRIKRSRPQISNTIRLLRLPPTVQRRVAAGVLSAGHARALVAVEDQLAQERLAQRVIAEGLSVRATEEMVTLGELGEQDRPRQQREPKAPSPRAAEVADQLSDVLETRVRVDIGKSKGRITIDFATEEDLERIASAINS